MIDIMKNHKVISIMTVYYPDKSNLDNAKKICSQSNLLIICDNSPTSNQKLFSVLENTKYFYWGKNLGLSGAFNKVLKNDTLHWADDDYVLFFDQDSTIQPDHIKTLISEYENLKYNGGSVGCIGPVYFNLNSNKEQIPRLKEYVNKQTMKVSSIITTSMLCQYKNLKKIGFWNEEIFLDMADWDICWRFYAANMNVYMTYVSVIRHSLGKGIKKVGPIRLSISAPFREYYQTRECLRLLFKPYVPFKYKLRFCYMLTVRPILHMLFLDHKIERAKYIGKGLIAYFAGKNGSL